MKNPVLVIMAAGMGSRYGGVKHIESVAQHAESLFDLATFDAKKSGFGKVVFESVLILKKTLGSGFLTELPVTLMRNMFFRRMILF